MKPKYGKSVAGFTPTDFSSPLLVSFMLLLLSGKDESLIMSSHLSCGLPIGFTLYLPDTMSKFRIGAMFHILTPSNLLIDV